MSPPEILLIDDDRRLADMVGRYLGQAGFAVQHQGTAREGLEALGRQVPGLVLLDLMLPDGDGLDVCRQIRQMTGAAATVPVLMLTARGETTDRIVGLEIGADDYLPKPFEPRELLARVRALLRRASAPHAADPAAAGEGQGGATTGAGASGAAGQTGGAAVSGGSGVAAGEDDCGDHHRDDGPGGEDGDGLPVLEEGGGTGLSPLGGQTEGVGDGGGQGVRQESQDLVRPLPAAGHEVERKGDDEQQ